MESVVLDNANYKHTKTLCNQFLDILGGAIHFINLCIPFLKYLLSAFI